MFKPNDIVLAALGRSARGPLIRASIVALLIPVGALAGISAPGADPGPLRPATGEPSTSQTPRLASGGYQLRCWQDGRLLFEQDHVALPATDASPYHMRLTATDRDGRQLWIAETNNATCLLRSTPAEENLNPSRIRRNP